MNVAERRGRAVLLTTGGHDCPYLPDRTACSQFLHPLEPVDTTLYELLLHRGFRRSGAYVYRPACPSCDACRSLRIPVAAFRPRRRHRRCLKRNRELHLETRPPRLTEEQYRLYLDYLRHRHPESDMTGPDIATAAGFLDAPWCESVFYEFRDGPEGRLLAVAVTDVLPDALSAVYTFYAPDAAHRGLGTLAILWQIHEARRLGLRHLYLGYWVDGSQTMEYKADFRPHECFAGDRFRPVPPNE